MIGSLAFSARPNRSSLISVLAAHATDAIRVMPVTAVWNFSLLLTAATLRATYDLDSPVCLDVAGRIVAVEAAFEVAAVPVLILMDMPRNRECADVRHHNDVDAYVVHWISPLARAC